MYEFHGGSGRLAYTLWVAANDGRLKSLAGILAYCEDQLLEDAQALLDYYQAFKDLDRPE